MKKIRTVISVVLIGCVAFGWIFAFAGTVKNASSYNKSIALARSYTEKGLYQKAISTYETALSSKSDQKVQAELLNAYSLGLEDGVVKASSFANAYQEACTKYPKNAKFWEELLSYYLSVSSYSKAYDLYKQMTKAGVKSELLSKLTDQLLYSYQIKPTNYSAFFRAPSGYFTVCQDERWGVLKSNGDVFSNSIFDYIVPMSAVGNCVLQSEKGTRVYSAEGVVQYILNESFSQARSYGNGLIPVNKSDDEWDYYKASEDSYAGENFEDASSFTNTVAAVKSSGKWKLIDTGFKQVSKQEFEDVKLYQNGEYTYGNVMIASQDGKYRIYDAQGKSKSDFVAEDIDNYYGGYMAFKAENGLWGYVSESGKVVIEPQFKEAKSFSKGLAAVSDDEKWGFIKTNGQLVIDYKYSFADYFTNAGFCMVSDAESAFYMIELRFA